MYDKWYVLVLIGDSLRAFFHLEFRKILFEFNHVSHLHGYSFCNVELQLNCSYVIRVGLPANIFTYYSSSEFQNILVKKTHIQKSADLQAKQKKANI